MTEIKKPRPVYDRDFVGWLRRATADEIEREIKRASAAGQSAFVALAEREQSDRRAKT